MAQATWEKTPETTARPAPWRSSRWKFLAGGLLILGAVVYLVFSNTVSGARFFITVEELVSNSAAYSGQLVRVTGAVIGDTIRYDPENLIIEFTVAHIPERVDNQGQALHEAVNDPNATRMAVRVENQPRPELLQHEAKAIMSGTLREDGVFLVSDLQLQCPSRFIESQPDQSIAIPME
ncbi:MAG: cytochrome c maturation protein CcmE [Aggregatilineales bacterium]